jgi:hypothetical protein
VLVSFGGAGHEQSQGHVKEPPRGAYSSLLCALGGAHMAREYRWTVLEDFVMSWRVHANRKQLRAFLIDCRATFDSTRRRPKSTDT